MIMPELLSQIAKADFIAVDTETNGLNVRKNCIIGLGIYGMSGNTSFSFYCTDHADMTEIAAAISKRRLLAWNAYFDFEMILNNLGIDLWGSLHADVILLKHTVDEEMPFGLKDVAAKIFGHEAKAEQEEVKASIKANGGYAGEIWVADPAIIAKYCLQDCKLTYELFIYYSTRLVKEGLEQFFYIDEVMPLYVNVTRQLQSGGIAVDIPLLTRLQADINNDIADLKNSIISTLSTSNYMDFYKKWYINKHFKQSRTGAFSQKCIEMSRIAVTRTPGGAFSLAESALKPFIGKSKWLDYVAGYGALSPQEVVYVQETLFKQLPQPFNISSKLDLKKVFFDQLGEKPLTKTALGAPQINDEFLKQMEQKYAWVKLLRDYNKLTKIKGTYIDRIIERSENGIYYPQFFQHRTVSGRFGSDLQQIPRVKETGSEIVLKYNNQLRQIFIARPGHKLIAADYESLEPRCFAHVSGEQVIKDIFAKGDDFYSTIAITTERLDGVSANKKAPNYLGTTGKAKRQAAKTYALGIPYGMEAFKLGKTLGIEQYDAERLIEKYFAGFPSLHAWFKQCDKDFKKYGNSYSEAGRVRHLQRQRAALLHLGDENLDSLELWKGYGSGPQYAQKKADRKFIRNGINNFKNFQIQSLAASITNRACIAISNKFKDLGLSATLVLQVHDEIVIECEEKDVQIAGSVLQWGMQESYKISVPLIANPVAGYKYGDIK